MEGRCDGKVLRCGAGDTVDTNTQGFINFAYVFGMASWDCRHGIRMPWYPYLSYCEYINSRPYQYMPYCH
jgi:hypothetical protein